MAKLPSGRAGYMRPAQSTGASRGRIVWPVPDSSSEVGAFTLRCLVSNYIASLGPNGRGFEQTAAYIYEYQLPRGF